MLPGIQICDRGTWLTLGPASLPTSPRALPFTFLLQVPSYYSIWGGGLVLPFPVQFLVFLPQRMAWWLHSFTRTNRDVPKKVGSLRPLNMSKAGHLIVPQNSFLSPPLCNLGNGSTVQPDARVRTLEAIPDSSLLSSYTSIHSRARSFLVVASDYVLNLPASHCHHSHSSPSHRGLLPSSKAP